MANPFKNLNELTRDVEGYLRKNSSTIYNNSKRISDFFEMACYNNIVRFYENNKFDVKIKNLIRNKFNYKCTTAGNPANYSYFEISKKINNHVEVFEVRHNVNIQSSHVKDIFTTPDISVMLANSIEVDIDFYKSATKYYYIKNEALVTFCEVKNFNPFPELLFNFVGIINELRPLLLIKSNRNGMTHISPSLLLSGKANDHGERIIDSLQSRYHINIISDLFNKGGITFGKKTIKRLKML